MQRQPLQKWPSDARGNFGATPSDGLKLREKPQKFRSRSPDRGVSSSPIEELLFNFAYLDDIFQLVAKSNCARGRSPGIASPPDSDELSRKDTVSMDVSIKLSVSFIVSDTWLEDAMAEYDELTVAGLIREIIDKSIACDEIVANVDEGPNSLEEFDQLSS